MITSNQLKEIILTALIIAVLGGCSAHLTLLALDKQADNQEQYIDEYNAQIEMGIAEYE